MKELRQFKDVFGRNLDLYKMKNLGLYYITTTEFDGIFDSQLSTDANIKKNKISR